MLLLALGVSADAFAVAVGKGLGMRRLERTVALRIAVTFGVFQALMPVIGWLLGSQLARYISAFDHWVAFGLLAFVGGRMILAAIREEGDEYDDTGVTHGTRGTVVLPTRELLVLGIATSIDALAVGIGFAFLKVDVPVACLLIGVTTALLSALGVWVGHRAGARFRRPAEVVGGVVLIAIGTRILLQHLGIW